MTEENEYIYPNHILRKYDIEKIIELDKELITNIFNLNSFNKIYISDILLNNDKIVDILDIINNLHIYKIYIIFGLDQTIKYDTKIKYLHKLIDNKNNINILFYNMEEYENIIKNTDIINFINNKLINKITFNNLTTTNLDLFYYVIKNNRTFSITLFDDKTDIEDNKCYFNDNFIEAFKNNNILNQFIIYDNSYRFITDTLINKLDENNLLNILQNINLSGLLHNKQLIPFLKNNKHVNDTWYSSNDDDIEYIYECLSENPYITNFTYEETDFKNDIPKLELKCLSKLLQSSNFIKSLFFNEYCNFYEDNIDYFKNAIINNNSITILKFIYCSFFQNSNDKPYDEDVSNNFNVFLNDILKDKNCSIQKLYIHEDDNSYPINLYTDIINSTINNNSLTYLNIADDDGDGDYFSYNTIQSISNLLKTNTTLTTLKCYTDNYINNCSGILKSLIHNTTLTYINLDFNCKLNKKDIYYLIELLKTNTTLTKIKCPSISQSFDQPEYTKYINYFIKAFSSNTSIYSYKGPYIYIKDYMIYDKEIKNVFTEILKQNTTLTDLPKTLTNID